MAQSFSFGLGLDKSDRLQNRLEAFPQARRAFQLVAGGTWDILTSHVAQDPSPPSELRPTITPTLNDLVLQCLAKSPDDRIQTTREVREILEVVRREEAKRLTHVDALFDRGTSHLERGEWREAASFFRKVIAANQDHADAARLLEEGETQLKQREAQRQQKVQSLYDQGLAHMQKEAFQEAAACFEEALTLAPDHIDVSARLEVVKQKLYETGVEHLEREEPQKAVDRFVTLVSLDVRYRDVAEKLEEARRDANISNPYGCDNLRDLGWRRATVDLGAYLGTTITIRFETWNRYDGWYNTWVYVDDVSVRR